ncbi:MAG: relaxase/mobilization nuclease domain-containing protein [Prevotella sp.]|nr:relaxase/mobilization nuclease domain-containing protein [Prevotella sp.]
MHLCNQSFAPFLAANKRTEEPILHISLNPHPDDVLADEQFIAIADEYMQKMGFGQQPYIVFKHEDIERKHIHIVSVNVDENGRKIDDFNNFHRSKKITKELEEKYKLHPADKLDYSEDTPRLKKVDYEAGDVKKQMTGNIKALMQSYRFTSLPEYRALLSIYNIGVEEVSGEVRGKQYQGLVYLALDNEGNKVGNPIKSSSIAKSVGYAALLKKAASSEKLIKENRLTERIKPILDTAINNYRNRQSFEAELLRNGIRVVFRENEDRRIYSATFIDHEDRAVFNGSKIGKAYSANVFHNLFQTSIEDERMQDNREAGNVGNEVEPVLSNQETRNAENDNISMRQPLELDVTARPKEREDMDTPAADFSKDTDGLKIDDTDFGSLPSLLEQHGADYEAEAFARRKEAEAKRRKRKGRRM